jgi:hypothetical protein
MAERFELDISSNAEQKENATSRKSSTEDALQPSNLRFQIRILRRKLYPIE